jgi:ribosomal protein S18 acetylase RimI-like enzyme
MNEIKPIGLAHILSAKILADANRDALGFIPRQKFEEAAEQQRGFVAIENDEVMGFVLYRHRKIDLQTTLSDICVRNGNRRLGIGRQLLEALIADSRTKSRQFIQLKCPVDLSANEFYRRMGFEVYAIEEGKKRKLNIWRLTLEPVSESRD